MQEGVGPLCICDRPIYLGASGLESNSGVSRDEAAPAEIKESSLISGGFSNGANRTRTGDLLGAIQALSQLSYSPLVRLEGSAGCTV